MNLGSTLPARQGWSTGRHAVCLRRLAQCLAVCLWLGLSTPAWSAATVPMEVQMPGTQPGEAGNLESPDKCDNCHQSNNPVVTIAHDWRGSMMSHAGRDPDLLGHAGDCRAGLRWLRRPLHPLSHDERLAGRPLHANRRLDADPGRGLRGRELRCVPQDDQSR